MDQRSSHVNRARPDKPSCHSRDNQPRPFEGPGLYVHIPFCLRKCPYCDFYSLPLDSERLAALPDLLITQLEQETHRNRWKGPFSTVFFGGGTPSLLPPAAIGRILQHAERLFGMTANAEITLEANPGTVTFPQLQDYLAAGINRLSFGVQSLNDRNLKRLGRIHTAADARHAVFLAQKAGFDNISCDLIFALPGQHPRAAVTDLEDLLQLSPQHISCYGLGIEPGTPFANQLESGDLQPASDETYAESFLLLHERLAGAGFTHYEISNYARKGRRCLHNLYTWRRFPYLGIGPGAHSFRAHGWGERRCIPPDLDAYREALAENRDPTVLLESFDRRHAMAETAYLGLRCNEGVKDAVFSEHFGMSFAEAFTRAIQQCGTRLIHRHGRWHLNLQGWLLFDHFISAFL